MLTDTDKLVRLTSVRTEMEAGVIVGGLEARGIEATMSGTYTTNFRCEAPGWVEILVSADDLLRAHSALELVREDRDDVDWSQVDVGKPEEEESSGASTAIPGVMRLKPWHQLATVLISFYLVFVGAIFVLSIISLVARSID